MPVKSLGYMPKRDWIDKMPSNFNKDRMRKQIEKANRKKLIKR